MRQTPTAWLASALLLLFCTSAFAQVGNDNLTGPAGIFNGDSQVAGDVDPYTCNSRRSTVDISVAGASGAQGLALVRTASSRGSGYWKYGFSQPGNWTHNYAWFLTSPESTTAGFVPNSYSVNFPDGRYAGFGYSASDVYYRAGKGVRERFIPLNTGTLLAYLVLADNTRIEFKATAYNYNDQVCDQFDHCQTVTYYGYTYVAQAIIDPYGLRTTLTYTTIGSDKVLYQVTEPAGRWLRFSYVSNRIDTVSASDGRSVKYTYGSRAYSPGTTVYAALDWVTYYGDNTLVAHYTYQAPNMPSYGNYNGIPLLKTAVDPMYAGPMWKIAYVYATGTNPDGTSAVVGQIKSENYYDGTNIGGAVTSVTVNGGVRTEVRGDNQPRNFTYTGNLLTRATDFNLVGASQGYDANNYVNSVTDRNGHTTNYTLNALTGKPTQVQFPATPNDAPAGRGHLDYTYGSASCADPNNKDPNNPYYPCTASDEAQHVIQYKRFANKRISEIDYPDGEVEKFTYDGYGHITSHTLPTTGVETYAYYLTANGDPAYKNGLAKEHRDPYHASGNPDARYDYDVKSRLSSLTTTLGTSLGDAAYTTSYLYNSRGQLTTTTLPTDPGDGTRHTIVNGYNSNGTLASMQDPLTHITTYQYDDYKRATTVTTPVRGYGDNGTNTTSYDYRQDFVHAYDHTPALPKRVTSPSGRITDFAYDGNWRKTVLRQAPTTIDEAWTYYYYDNVGNLTQVKDPRTNFPVTTVYDERNRPWKVTDAASKTTVFAYDNHGRKASMTRPNNQVVSYDSYDPMNRLLQQTATQTPEPSAVTNYAYDPTGGQLQTMTDPNGNVYTYGYDLLNRKTRLTYPGGSTEAWTYENTGGGARAGDGLLYQFKNRAGNTDTFTYDKLNRMTLSHWDDGLTPDVTTGYDAANRVTGITNSNSTISRAYYNDNLLHIETNTYGDGIARVVPYTYDPDGRRASLTYPNNDFAVTYTYTHRGQLDTILVGSTTVANYDYYTDGALYLRALDNGTSSTYTLDALDRPTNISIALAGATRTFDYGYDNVGNRDWVKRDGNLGDVYDYDLADQAITTKLNIANPDTTAPGPATIVYDANGNRTSFSAYGTTDSYGAANNLNQYPTRNSVSAVYDTKGNMTTGFDGSIYTYDAQNRLLTARKGSTTDTFLYDGLNRQIGKKIGSAAMFYRVYDGWDLLGEYQSGSNTAFWAYLHGPTGVVKNLATNNYYYQDASGSTTHLADNAGNLIESYLYDLHGTPTFYNAAGTKISATKYGMRHLFTGQQWYSELSLYDLRNRYYSPDTGRFLQADPSGFGGDASNLYRYCGNNTLVNSDPTGLGDLDRGDAADYNNRVPDGQASVGGWVSGNDVSGLSNITVNLAESTYSLASYSSASLGFSFFLNVAQSFGAGGTTAYTNGIHDGKAYPFVDNYGRPGVFTTVGYQDRANLSNGATYGFGSRPIAAQSAIDGAWNYNSTPKYPDGAELSGILFQNPDKSFGYTIAFCPSYNNPFGSSTGPDSIPGVATVGIWHIQAGGGPQNSYFSGGDLSEAQRLGVPNYMGDLQGGIYRIDPQNHAPAVRLVYYNEDQILRHPRPPGP